MTVFKKSLLTLGLAIIAFSAALVIFSIVFMNNLYYEINTIALKNTARTLFYAIGEDRIIQILQDNKDTQTLINDIDIPVSNQGDHRLTLVASSGYVVWDSHVSERLVNHLDREEIEGALAGIETSASRNSLTTGDKLIYFALPVFDYDNNSVGAFRVSVSVPGFIARLSSVIVPFLVISCFLVIIALWAIYAYSFSLADSVGRLVSIAQSSSPFLSGSETNQEVSPEFRSLEKALRAMTQELYRRFEQAKEEGEHLAKLERVRKDFVANVSHELRTPIQLIKGFSETIKDMLADDNETNKQILHFTDIINKNAGTMENLTNDLLILADLENNANNGRDMEDAEIEPLIKEAVLSLDNQAKKKNIEVITYCEKNLIAKLYPAFIIQALINLIDNAIKYSSENSKIWITAAENNDELMFEVRDMGIGIPKEHQERIFERFYRVDKGRSKEIGGTGLGLSIVRHIALLHKGKIEVISPVQTGGSVFRIIIPYSN